MVVAGRANFVKFSVVNLIFENGACSLPLHSNTLSHQHTNPQPPFLDLQLGPDYSQHSEYRLQLLRTTLLLLFTPTHRVHHINIFQQAPRICIQTNRRLD
jgi:hypothetical protein